MAQGTDLSGSSLWNVANVKDFGQAVDDVGRSISALGDNFRTMAEKANAAVRSVREELKKLQGDLGDSGLGGKRSVLADAGRSNNGRGGWGGGGYNWGGRQPTTDAMDSLSGRPNWYSPSPWGGGANGGYGADGQYGYGFSWGRLAVGGAAAVTGLAARAVGGPGGGLVQQGITQSQLNTWLQTATGGQLGRKWAMNLPNWAWSSSNSQNLGDLRQGLQTLQVAGSVAGSPLWQQRALQTGALANIGQNMGLGTTFGQMAQFQAGFAGNAGYYGRMRAGLDTTNTNIFSNLQTLAQRQLNGRAWTAQNVGAAFSPNTSGGLQLSALTGGDPTMNTALTSVAQRLGPRGLSALAAAKTPQQFNQALSQAGLGGTVTSKLEKAQNDMANATANMADNSAKYYATARQHLASIAKYTSTLPLIRNLLGVAAGFGGLSAVAGGSIGGAANAAGGLRALRGLGSRISKWRGVGSEVADGAGTGAARTSGLGGRIGNLFSRSTRTPGIVGASTAEEGAVTTGGMTVGSAVSALPIAYAINDRARRSHNQAISGLATAGHAASDLMMGNVSGAWGTAKGWLGNHLGGIFGQGSVGQTGGNVGMPTTAPASGGNSAVAGLAEKYLGVPYVWGGTTPKGFDCSGFTQYVYKQLGVGLPRLTYDQVKTGTAVPNLGQAKPGDLLFFDQSARGPEHVGIYMGNGKMIDAPHTGSRVRIESVWTNSLSAIRRELPGNGNAASSSTVGSVPVSSTASPSGTISMPGPGMLAGPGEGNAAITESATIASSMFATFSAPTSLNTGTQVNGGTQGNTINNGGSSAGSSVPVGPIGSIANPTQWAQAVLSSLDDPLSAANIRSFVNWAKIEGGHWANSARFNPINTTQREHGSTSMNSVGVQAYTSWQQGVQATADTLRNGLYGDLLGALKSGKGIMSGRFASLLKWSGGGYSAIPSFDVGSQYIDRDQLAMLHRGEQVVRAGDASARRMLQGSSRTAPLINVEKGAITFSVGTTSGVGGTSGSTSLPSQQSLEEMAGQFWSFVERKASLAKVASD